MQSLPGRLFELASLKHYLERHEGEPRSATYLRRRVPLSREAAWERLLGSGAPELEPLIVRVVDRCPPWQLAAVVRAGPPRPPGGGAG